MLKLYHIKITVRQHCVNNSSKIIKNNGNNKFIVYFCIRYCVLLHKISCARQCESKLSFLSLALSLHKISCAREIKSKLSFLSLALSLHSQSHKKHSFYEP